MLLFSIAALRAPSALAVPTAVERNLAEQLFVDGKRLMSEGAYEEACPKLAESHRLDPGGGTILNLAVCHAAQGRYASAWSEFREAIDLARTDGRSDREEFAVRELAKIEAKLSYLTIVVEQGTEVPGLSVTLNGHVIGAAAWGAPFPIDPGVHEIVASAPGKKDRRASVRIEPLSDSKAVSIGALELAEPAHPSPRGALPDLITPPTYPKVVVAKSGQDATAPTSGPHTLAYVVTGVGVAALGAGVFAGVSALDKRAESDRYCSGATCISRRGIALNDDAQRLANYANAGIGVGVASLLLGTYLFVTSGDEAARGSAARGTTAGRTLHLSPVLEPKRGQLRLWTTW